jgi:hypothetical protein
MPMMTLFSAQLGSMLCETDKTSKIVADGGWAITEGASPSPPGARSPCSRAPALTLFGACRRRHTVGRQRLLADLGRRAPANGRSGAGT